MFDVDIRGEHGVKARCPCAQTVIGFLAVAAPEYRVGKDAHLRPTVVAQVQTKTHTDR